MIKNGHYIPCGLVTIRPGNGDTISAMQSDPGWGNVGINGVLLRIPWTQIQSSTTDPTVFDWSYPDAAFVLAAANNQFLGFEISAGHQYTPPWVFANGGASFSISGYGTVCPPWDPVFRGYVKTFLAAFAERYGANPYLSYFQVMALGNRNAQCDFSQACADNAAMLSAALSAGLTCTDTSAACSGALTGVEIWEAAALTLAGDAISALPGVSIIIGKGQPAWAKGTPYFTAAANIAAAHGSAAGIQDFALSATYSMTQLFATTMLSVRATNPVGLQELSGAGTLANLNSEFSIANQLGAWWIEIYHGDLSIGSAQPFLVAQNQQMTAAVTSIANALWPGSGTGGGTGSEPTPITFVPDDFLYITGGTSDVLDLTLNSTVDNLLGLSTLPPPIQPVVVLTNPAVLS